MVQTEVCIVHKGRHTLIQVNQAEAQICNLRACCNEVVPELLVFIEFNQYISSSSKNELIKALFRLIASERISS